MGCAKEFESRVAAMKTGDCDGLDARAAELWGEIRKQCDLRHQAFDAAQQRLLVKSPFIKLVLGTSRPGSTTVSIHDSGNRSSAALAH